MLSLGKDGAGPAGYFAKTAIRGKRFLGSDLGRASFPPSFFPEKSGPTAPPPRGGPWRKKHPPRGRGGGGGGGGGGRVQKAELAEKKPQENIRAGLNAPTGGVGRRGKWGGHALGSGPIGKPGGNDWGKKAGPLEWTGKFSGLTAGRRGGGPRGGGGGPQTGNQRIRGGTSLGRLFQPESRPKAFGEKTGAPMGARIAGGWDWCNFRGPGGL